MIDKAFDAEVEVECCFVGSLAFWFAALNYYNICIFIFAFISELVL